MKPFRKIDSFKDFVLEQSLPNPVQDKGYDFMNSEHPYPRLVKLPNGKMVTRYFSDPGKKLEEEPVEKLTDDEIEDAGEELKKGIDKKLSGSMVGRDKTALNKEITTPDGKRVIISPPQAGWRFSKPPADDGKIDIHDLFLYATLGTIALPFLGVSAGAAAVIGAGLGLTEAAIYYLEKDYKMGSAMAFFSMIPIAGKFIGQVFVKSGLKYTPQLFEMSESFYKTLVGKLSGSKKLTEIEVKFLRNIIKFRKQILDGFNNYIKNKSSKLLTDKNLLSKFGKEVQVETAGVLKGLTQGIGYFAKSLYGSGKKTMGLGVKLAKGFAPWIIGFEAFQSAWDWVQDAKGDIDYGVSKEGGDWENTKKVFGSDGSKSDNMKLKKAWEKGWRPGLEVPKDLQTPTYVENTSKRLEEEENIAKLEELLSR